MATDQIGQRVGVQQRDVPRGDDDGAREVVGQCRQPAGGGVPGAKLLLLDRDADGATDVVGQLDDRRGDAVTIVAKHDDKVLRSDLGRRIQGVRQHTAPGQRVQHLWGVRAHAAAPSGGQD